MVTEWALEHYLKFYQWIIHNLVNVAKCMTCWRTSPQGIQNTGQAEIQGLYFTKRHMLQIDWLFWDKRESQKYITKQIILKDKCTQFKVKITDFQKNFVQHFENRWLEEFPSAKRDLSKCEVSTCLKTARKLVLIHPVLCKHARNMEG